MRHRGERLLLRQAVILVGGLGTRLGSLTRDVPKPMLPVAGEPFLDILLRNIVRHGFEDIILLARHQAQNIRDHYASRRIGNASIRVLEETAKAGTGGALREAASELDEVFLLSNGDSLFDFNYLALAQHFREKACTLALALREVPDVSRYGQVGLDISGKVVSFAEKNRISGGPGLINGGVYVVSRQILKDIGSGEISLENDVIPPLIKRGHVYGKQFDGYFLDIGIPASYTRAQHELPAQMNRKVVFFDRDGTLNRDEGYTHKVEDLVWLPGSMEVIRRCNEAGRLVIVLTNQAGIAYGYYDIDQMHRFNRAMNDQLREQGAHIDAFYFCPHHPNGAVANLTRACSCRKPGTGLFEQACGDWPIDLSDAVMIGDKPSDLAAAKEFGVRALRTDGSDLENIFENIEI